MRTVKPHSSRAYGPSQTSIVRWPASGWDEGSDRLYWTHAPDALFAVRPSADGQFIYKAINPAFETILGMSAEKIRGMPVSDCMGREDAIALHQAFQACLAEGAEVRIHHRLAFGGAPRHVETIVAPICDPDTRSVALLIGSHRTLKRRSATVDPAPGDHAGMSAKLLSIQQNIQQRIASDLHDSTCQHLIAASLTVMRIRAALHNPAHAERLCNDLDASIDQALKELRAFAYLLHPQNLTEDGLKATIEHYACGFAARTSLKVTTEIAPEVDRLPYKKQRSLLRVIQEALTNVFRHAKATEVGVAIKATDDEFRLRVKDNGRGMPGDRPRYGTCAPSLGVGIPAMRVRLQQLGGTLVIRSALAERSGTTVCAVIPRHLANKQRSQRKALVVVKGSRST